MTLVSLELPAFNIMLCSVSTSIHTLYATQTHEQSSSRAIRTLLKMIIINVVSRRNAQCPRYFLCSILSRVAIEKSNEEDRKE